MEKELTYDVRKLSPKEQEELRKKIVRQKKKDCESREVAAICESSLRHVQSTWKKYQEGGVKAISAVKMGCPKGKYSKLTLEQSAEIIKELTEKTPKDCGLTGYLWDRKAVSELVKQRFGVEMPLSTMGYYLKKWNFTCQRPQKKDYRQDASALKEWVEVTYPAIVKQAAEENAEIWWVDQTGARNASNYIRGYAPKGETPTLPVASAHTGVNMISSITNNGGLRYDFYCGKFNQNIYMDFLKRLINTTDRKVFVIADNSSTHHGLLVKEWKEKHTDDITIFHLPSYAPHLNPVEYLNNNLKSVLLKQGYSVSEAEVEQIARVIMRSFLATKGRVASFFEHDDVKYAKSDA